MTSMRKSVRLLASITFGILAAIALFVVNVLSNYPQVCGRTLAPWATLADRLLFLPTIWVTSPLDSLLGVTGHPGAIWVSVIIEEVLLAVCYAIVFDSLIRRRVTQRFRSLRRGVPVIAGVVLLLVAVSIWARQQLNQRDFGKPIVHDSADVALVLKSPEQSAALTLRIAKEISVPGDSAVIARSGIPPLILTPGTFSRDVRDGPGIVYALRGDVLVPTGGVWPTPLTGTEPRIALGSADPIVVISGSARAGFGTNELRAIPFSALASGKGVGDAVSLPEGMQSPMLLRADKHLVATGFTYGSDTANAAVLPFEGRTEGQSLLSILDLSTPSSPVLIGAVSNFGDHQTNNLASAATEDGVVHLLGTEVSVEHNNSARVVYMQFDPHNHRWLDHRVLFVRTSFTSSINPRLVATLSGVDAFWLPEAGGSTLKDDGLYALHIGETTTWRLTSRRGEYAVLPDADGNGALLVGVAEKPNEDGRIRWFVRRKAIWYSAGETNLGKIVYTLIIDGTEPFALWRDEATQTIRAAFRSEKGLIVADITLPPG
jgi:hypothetical protein